MKAKELIEEYVKEEKQDEVHVLAFFPVKKQEEKIQPMHFWHVHRDEEIPPKMMDDGRKVMPVIVKAPQPDQKKQGE